MKIELDIYEKDGELWHDTITEEDIIEWWKKDNKWSYASNNPKVVIDKVVI